MAVKMNLRIITKNHAADPEKGFLTKSISKPNGCARAMPTAWELRESFEKIIANEIIINKIDLAKIIELRQYLCSFLIDNGKSQYQDCTFI